MMHNLNGKTRREKAQTMVEFALVFPILLVLVYGIIEFGRLLFIYSAVTTASREASRYGSAAGKGAGISINTAANKYNDCAGIRAAARRSAVAVSLPDSAITITYDSGPNTTQVSATCPAPAINLGDRIVVTVTANYSPIMPVPFLSNIPIRSSTGRTILKDIRVEGTPIALGDIPPRLSFFIDRQEVDESVGKIEVTVMLDAPSKSTVTAQLFLGGDAAADDYVLNPTSISIPAGDTYVRLQLTINDDLIDEYDEILRLVLGMPTNADPGTPSTFTLTIFDNDDPPKISFQTDAQIVNEDVGSLAIPVVLTDAAGALTYSGKPVSVDFAFAGTATLGSDYILSSSPLAIPPGQTGGFIIVTITGPDRLDELDETIELNLANPSEATLTNPDRHTITVIDVDVPKVSFEDELAIVDETVAQISITILMDIPSTQDIFVAYALAGTATPNTDYRIDPSPLRIPAGSTSISFNFFPIKDSEPEIPFETIEISLIKPASADLGTPSRLLIQMTDEYEPPNAYFTVKTVRVPESAGTYVLTVRLSRFANAAVIVPFSLSGDAITDAKEDNDYTYTPNSRSVNIPVGSLEATITFTLIADGIDEDDETILVTMGAPTNAGLGTPNVAAITIEDSDPTPALSFNGVSKVVAEDVGQVSIPLRLSSPSSKTVSVTFRVVPAPSTLAKENIDYAAFTNFTVTFPPKTTAANIDVQVLDNPEPDLDPRDLVLELLSPPVNALLANPTQYTVTIRDIQVCPRFASAQRDNTLKFLSFSLVNDRQYATDVYIENVILSWPLASTQRVTGLKWLDVIPAEQILGSFVKDSPISVYPGKTWTLVVPGGSPAPPATGYRLEIDFADALNPISTYTITIRYSNGCVRQRSTTTSSP